VSCALHVLEEYLTGWQRWAAQTLGIVMPTTRFPIANAILVFFALLLARVGWRRPDARERDLFSHPVDDCAGSCVTGRLHGHASLPAVLLLGVAGCAARWCTRARSRRSDGWGDAHDAGIRCGCEMAGRPESCGLTRRLRRDKDSKRIWRSTIRRNGNSPRSAGRSTNAKSASTNHRSRPTHSWPRRSRTSGCRARVQVKEL
jgi:hypothetical protein